MALDKINMKRRNRKGGILAIDIIAKVKRIAENGCLCANPLNASNFSEPENLLTAMAIAKAAIEDKA